MQTLPPTHVTSSSATLRAQVQCSFNANGAVWWELRAPGGTWKAAGDKSIYACGHSNRSISLSKTVTGLKAGTAYQYRLVADPNPKGGFVVYRALRGWPRPQPQGPGRSPPASSPPPPKPAPSRGSAPTSSGVEFDISAPGLADAHQHRPDRPRRARARCCSPASRAACRPGRCAEPRQLGRRVRPGRPLLGRPLRRRAGGATIEFGNETSYGYQYGDNYGTASYADRAENYARRFAHAAGAIAMTGRSASGLLAQADDGGSGSAELGQPHVPSGAEPGHDGRRLDGPPLRPARPLEAEDGPARHADRRQRRPGAIPIDVTEYGISSDNGASLSDNYGWPATLTYAQAACARDGAPRCALDPASGGGCACS